MVGLWSVQEGLPPTTVLERIVRDLREEPVVMTHGEVAKLTFSGGGCRWGAGDDIRGLLSRADDALYRAKADWGNTVVHLDQGGSTSRCNLASMR